MAELNWIPKEERLPTAEDAKSNSGAVYAVWSDGLVDIMHFSQVKSRERVTHWLPFNQMPVPKRWRVPTIHDLAKAGKPIPCRVHNDQSVAWFESMLCAVDLHPHSVCKFMTLNKDWFRYCEICDE